MSGYLIQSWWPIPECLKLHLSKLPKRTAGTIFPEGIRWFLSALQPFYLLFFCTCLCSRKCWAHVVRAMSHDGSSRFMKDSMVFLKESRNLQNKMPWRTVIIHAVSFGLSQRLWTGLQMLTVEGGQFGAYGCRCQGIYVHYDSLKNLWLLGRRKGATWIFRGFPCQEITQPQVHNKPTSNMIIYS